MTRRYSTNLARTLLLLLFVWAQAAVAVHDVEHNWHESSELCQALQSAEHNKLVVDPSAAINVDVAAVILSSQPKVASISLVLLAKPARSPPLTAA